MDAELREKEDYIMGCCYIVFVFGATLAAFIFWCMM